MKNLIILITLLSIFSCKKNIANINQNNSLQGQFAKNKDSVFQFKSIGKSIIKDYNFPKEWKINTYDDENIILKKEDIEAQKRLEEIDYFNNLKNNKIEKSNKEFSDFVKKDR